MTRTALSLLLTIALTHGANADTIRMAVTSSFNNSGLSDVLLPAAEEDLGLRVELLIVGTGQALALGENGDVDAILVHAPEAEEEFVAAGHGTYRREIMYNDFVFLGPKDDPAGLASARNIVEVMDALSEEMALYVSRGDESGTHKKEQQLWTLAGHYVGSFDDWYLSVGSGMGASLNTATGLSAYIMSDRGSWLNFRNKSDLTLLFSGDPKLFNQYSLIPINPERHAHIKIDLVQKLEDWLTGQRAADLINGYQIDGETLFIFNATDG